MTAIPSPYTLKEPVTSTPTSFTYDAPAVIFNRKRVPNFSQLDRLINWPGERRNDMLAPSQKTIDAAKSWLSDLYCYADSMRKWIEPNITVSEDADVVFEWWHDTRKLTVYVSSQGAEYIKVWGSDIFNEMEDGMADDAQTCRTMWAWLMG
jgi:hypothetical protein